MMRRSADREDWRRITRLAAVTLRRLDRHLAASAAAPGASLQLPDQSDLMLARLDHIEHAVSTIASQVGPRFETEVLDPLTRRLFPAMDILTDAAEHAVPGARESLLGARSEIMEALRGYGVDPLRARRGASFDPRWMRPEQVRTASSRHQHLTIAAMTKLGFRRGKRVLRPASVVVLKYKEDRHADNGHRPRIGPM